MNLYLFSYIPTFFFLYFSLFLFSFYYNLAENLIVFLNSLQVFSVKHEKIVRRRESMSHGLHNGGGEAVDGSPGVVPAVYCSGVPLWILVGGKRLLAG